MASQWQRLRSRNWLRLMGGARKRSQEEGSLLLTSVTAKGYPWMHAATLVAGVTTIACTVLSETIATEDDTSLMNQSQQEQKDEEGIYHKGFRNSTTTAAPTLSQSTLKTLETAPLRNLPPSLLKSSTTIPRSKIFLLQSHTDNNIGIVNNHHYCNCEEAAGGRFSLFGRKSNLRRSNTIVRYRNEVSRETVRSRYKVNWKKPLGQGGFGAVYAATDRRTGAKVALKQISKKYTDDIGFQREMEAFLTLRRAGGHPNICGLHENFDEGNYFYFSLDLVSGGEMFDHLIRSGPYSEEDAARLVREVASALDFLHGIGIVHGDLKPENLMLSTEKTSDAVIKLIDFGCAQVTQSPDEQPGVVGLTAAYSSPEMLLLPPSERKRIDPPLDMWALGIILHIMLVGCHPFDLTGDLPDTKISKLVCSKKTPPSLEKDSPMTSHLSDSAMDVIRRLLAWDPNKRVTAAQMLEHPWVRGETARKDKISGSDKKLSKFRVFKSRLEAKVFEDIVSWADMADSEEVSKRTSLIERSFRLLDEEQKGFITAKDLKKLTGPTAVSPGDPGTENESLSLSAFSSLLSDNMKDRYFPKGRILYREGEEGHSMLFINSGKLEVSTKDGYSVEVNAGNFVGEGALISPEKTRNATVRTLTPVHAIEISREHFEKYLAASENRLSLHMREKDKKRALKRTKNILRRQRELKALDLKKGDYIFREGEESNEMYIVEEGMIDAFLKGQPIATSHPGEMLGVGSLITHRKRNSTAICASKTCRIHMMKADDFFEFMDSSPILKASVHDVFLRKEFAKAVALKTKKKFPMSREELRIVFDSIDTQGDGFITQDELRALLINMDEDVPESLVSGILNSLDIDASGVVDFGEFCQIFLSKEEGKRVGHWL